MLKNLLMILMFMGTSMTCLGQTTPPTPPPAPPTPPAPQNTPLPTQTPYPQNYRVAIPLSGMPRADNFAVSPASQLQYRQMMVQRFAQELYRKPSEKELAEVLPNPTLVKRYDAVLRSPNSGIFKLVPDAGCAQDSKVLDVRPECLRYSFPGSGNSYSFRTESYRIRHLADITLIDGRLMVTGELMNGILVDIGDVPLERIGLENPARRFLADFKPIDDFAAAKRIDDALARGVGDSGYIYSKAVNVQMDRTYLLRVVAYRGTIMRSIKGFAYDELDFDKRRDMLVAFRVVEVASDGSVTIVWTTQQTARSPKLKVPKNEADGSNKKTTEKK